MSSGMNLGSNASEEDLLNIYQVIHVVYHDQPDVSFPYFAQASSGKRCELQPNAAISELLATRATHSCVNRSEVTKFFKAFSVFLFSLPVSQLCHSHCLSRSALHSFHIDALAVLET